MYSAFANRLPGMHEARRMVMDIPMTCKSKPKERYSNFDLLRCVYIVGTFWQHTVCKKGMEGHR